jgi:hypothetical protein
MSLLQGDNDVADVHNLGGKYINREEEKNLKVKEKERRGNFFLILHVHG